MKLTTGFEDRKARVEMISLLDVMFLILVFFIYSIFSMSVHRGVKVELPGARGARLEGETAVITLKADGSLLYNRLPMPGDEIVKRAVAEWRASGTPVLISGDRAASLGDGIGLLARLKEAGVEKVAFQVDGKAYAPPALPEAAP